LAKRAVAIPNIEPDSDAYGGVGAKVNLTGDYLIVLQHPVTTEYRDSRRNVEETLHAIAAIGMPALWFWPNVDAGSDGTSEGIRAFREAHKLSHVHFVKNVPPEEFLRLAYSSRCIVGNSSVAIRECSWLGVPAVNIGTRQADRDRGVNVMDVPYDRVEIERAIRSQIGRGRLPPDSIYGDGHAGERMAEILAEVPLSIEKRLPF
jgi:UDP-N-acetylglucosamine 2-epimerase